MVAKSSIPRSATFAWSPETTLLATGSFAEALDESFSNEARLEIWNAFPSSAKDDFLGDNAERQPEVLGSVTYTSRFNKVAWGRAPHAVLAAGLENGELCVWDTDKIAASAQDEALIWKQQQHNGPVRGLDFNATQKHVLATGATNGEIWVWDLNNPQKPYSPGTRSRNLEDITSLAWNKQVPHILATSSSSGYTVVWDLRNKREVVALTSANANSMQQNPAWMNPQQGVRRGISSVTWHPDNPTKIATASEDDMNPIVMVWDLRNPRAPEKTLTGHEKGILGMDWCSVDSDLLISCGKDSRTICWNPNSGEMTGELSRSTNWAFQAGICPRLPDLVAVSSFDGKIDMHPLQYTKTQAEIQAEQPSGADIFEQGNLNVQSYPAVSLKQAPKWLRRPVSAVFGFGGKLITLNSKASGGHAIKIHQVVTESNVVERALKLEHASEEKKLAQFAEERISQMSTSKSPGAESAHKQSLSSWQLLSTLFRADSRDELVTLLGFSKEDVKSKVDAGIKAFQEKAQLNRVPSEARINSTASETDETGSVAREPLVTFAEINTTEKSSSHSASTESEVGVEPSDASASVSGYSESTKPGASTESETTEPSLWGEENFALNLDGPGALGANVNATNQSAADFYNTIGSGRAAALPDYLRSQIGEQSSVAATIGSRPSSTASADLLKGGNTFKIYPAEESDAERLITRALMLGDFASAVSLCMSAERYADALLLAVRGGPELLATTQKAYFERQTKHLPYLRVFQSIASDDLSDVVQNADISEWQEIFVILCTFAKKEEFANLVEQLGHRLEFQSTLSKGRESTMSSKDLRKDAVLCYLAAGKLEKVVSIWSEEMREEEALDSSAAYSAHANALQSFIEKVAIFQAATNYVDADLSQPTTSTAAATSGARTYKLALLYDRYGEYAELLAAQGLANLALRYATQIPADYGGASSKTNFVQERLVQLTSKKSTPKNVSRGNVASAGIRTAGVPPNPSQFSPYGAPSVPLQGPPQIGAYAAQQIPQATQNSPYAPANVSQPPSNSAYGQQAVMPPNQSRPFPQPPPAFGASAPQQTSQQSFIPQPPAPVGFGASQQMNVQTPNQQINSGPPPPSSIAKRPDQGWNDAPSLPPPPKRTGSAMAQRSAIASPFPNQMPPHRAPSRGPTPAGISVVPGPPPPRSSVTSPPPPRSSAISPPPSRQPQLLDTANRGFSPMNSSPMQPMHPVQPPQSQSQYAPHLANNINGTQSVLPPNLQNGPSSNNSQYGPPSNVQPGLSHASSPYDPPVSRSTGPPSMSASGHQRPGIPGPPVLTSQTISPPPLPQSNISPIQPQAPKLEQKPEPPKPKYPPGDRSHISDSQRPIFDVLTQRLQIIRQNTPPQQKKMVDDTERRLNVLFDGLNCGTMSKQTVDILLELIQAIEAHNAESALDLHLRMLTSGAPSSDHMTAWSPAVKIIARFA